MLAILKVRHKKFPPFKSVWGGGRGAKRFTLSWGGGGAKSFEPEISHVVVPPHNDQSLIHKSYEYTIFRDLRG